jgi:hypothetical protein
VLPHDSHFIMSAPTSLLPYSYYNPLHLLLHKCHLTSNCLHIVAPFRLLRSRSIVALPLLRYRSLSISFLSLPLLPLQSSRTKVYIQAPVSSLSCCCCRLCKHPISWLGRVTFAPSSVLFNSSSVFCLLTIIFLRSRYTTTLLQNNLRHSL